MSVESLWDECVSAACLQQASSWTSQRVGDLWDRLRGPGIQAVVPDRQGDVSVLGGSANVRVLVNLESGVCVPSLVNFYLYQPKSCLYFCLM